MRFAHTFAQNTLGFGQMRLRFAVLPLHIATFGQPPLRHSHIRVQAAQLFAQNRIGAAQNGLAYCSAIWV